MKDDPTMHEIKEFVDAIPRPHPSLRARVMQSVPPDTQPQRGPRWMGAAAVILAAFVVVTLVLGIRSFSHGPRPAGRPTSTSAVTPSPSPAATAAPAPVRVAGPLNVPDSTPVIPFRDTGSDVLIAAVAWSGGQPGLLGVPAPVQGRGSASPDGSRFLLDAGRTSVYDRHGSKVGDVPLIGKTVGTWADDSRHLCAMRYSGTATSAADGPTTLVVSQPGEAARDVAQVGRLQAQSGPSVMACSIVADTAVVTQSIMGNTQEIWMVRLSTGAVLAHHTYATDSTSSTMVTASRDGALLAETRQPFPAGSGPTTTSIRRTADRSELARVDGRVAGFSWDGELAVILNDSGTGASVVRWRTGETLWTAPPGHSVGPVLAEPNGSHVAVGLNVTGRVDLWIVGPDGARLALTGVNGLL